MKELSKSCLIGRIWTPMDSLYFLRRTILLARLQGRDGLREFVRPYPSLSHALHTAPNQHLFEIPSLSVIIHERVVIRGSITITPVMKWSLMEYSILENYAAKTGHLQDENLIFNVVNDFLLFLLCAVGVDVQCSLHILMTHDGLDDLHIGLGLTQSSAEGMS